MTKRLIIGIDTGGTYTDAAVIDANQARVLATAKAVTTKGDLSLGVAEAMGQVLAKLGAGINPTDIARIGISTTLATNAVVEGHGSSAAAVLIGFDDAMVTRSQIPRLFPGLPTLRITGGHDHDGRAISPLDTHTLRRDLTNLTSDVTAFAVASAFAVRNPAHEIAARNLIAEVTGKPVTLSRELSSSLDAPRRALTAVLNARLISRISLLIEAVKRAMAGLHIEAPLMIVRGDGSLAMADEVAFRPIETILSGPAASLIGAHWLSRLDDFILSDVGGTTTDLGVLINGRPRIAEQGAEVGGKRTMVQAIDLRTLGLGGDSEVSLEGPSKITIGPQRVTPLALLNHRFPETLAMLQADVDDTPFTALHGRFVALPFGQHATDTALLPDREAVLLRQVTATPQPLRRLVATAAALRTLSSLQRKGLVQIASFTPSDAAHVLGLQQNWPGNAAFLGAKALLRLRDMRVPNDGEVQNFCSLIWDEVIAKSAEAVAETATGEHAEGSKLFAAVCRGQGTLGLARINISPMLPVVAVGGPARIIYQGVAQRLNCDVRFVENFDVANAVGAGVGQVWVSAQVFVEGDGSGLFRLFGGDGVEQLMSGSEALARAEALARDLALQLALRQGAVSPIVTVTMVKSYLPNAMNEDGLLKAEIRADAGERTGINFHQD